MKNKYMHLIDGRPAIYYKDGQICFMRHGDKIILCESLRQVRKEQAASYNWRIKIGYRDIESDYGYLRVRV